MVVKYLLLPLVLCLIAFEIQAQDQAKAMISAFHSISSNDMLQDAAELTSAKYGGRLSGSPGYMLAAKWVAGELKKAGVRPGLGDSTYLQYFPNDYSEVLSPGSLILLKGKQNTRKEYHFPGDYFPGSNSASGTVSGEVVYVGYGITAPELGYDDYSNLDVKGKILLMETGVPYGQNDSIQLKWEPYSYHRYKFQHAKELGAAGLLYVSKIANPNTSFLKDFIYAHISDSVAAELFAGSGKNYVETRSSISKNLRPDSKVLNKKISITARTNYFPDSQSCNVIGIVEGSDSLLKKEAIVIGAHLDGVGSPGTLFPGALDNASGSVDILAAAKALAGSGLRPARTVIFVFFGGEECGLYGSKKYVESPVWPAGKVVCMINLDMVGNGTGFFLANGKTHASILKHFSEANEKYLHRSLNASEVRTSYSRPRTDGAIFEKAGYKVVHLYTSGTVKPVYYHHPMDNTDALTPEIMEDAAKLLYLSLLGIGNDSNLGSK